jgi:hypothetical protein
MKARQIIFTLIRFKKVLFLACTLFMQISCIAQSTSNNITIPSLTSFGFPNEGVKAEIRSVPNGNIWVGFGQRGILYYDNTSWSYINKSNTPALLNDSCYTLFVDKLSTIWIANKGGLIRKNNAGYISYPFNTTGTFPKNLIYDIEVSGNKTFIASNKGLSVLDTNTSVWNIYNSSNSTMFTDTVLSLSVDPSGNVWMGFRSGFSVYNNGTITNYIPSNPSFINNQVVDIAVTNYDTLFNIKNIGVFRYNNGNYDGFGDYLWRADSTSFCDPGMFYSSYNSYNYPSSRFAIDSNENIYFLANETNLINIDIFYNLKSRNTKGVRNGFPSNILEFYKADSLFILSNYFDFNYKRNNLLVFEKIDVNNNYYQYLEMKPTNGSIFYDQKIPASYLSNTQADLVANKVSARLLNCGDVAYDPIGSNPHYLVSSGTKTTVYANEIWLGGYDQNNQLYVAGHTYRQRGGTDFWPGPLDSTGHTDSTVFKKFDHIWMTNRADIDEFRHQFSIGNVQSGTFIVSDYILNWPAFYNDPAYPQKLAPFVDFNSDGLYDPYDGDYPDVKGDQSAWFVFNDMLSLKTETSSLGMGVEIHGSSFGFNCSDYTDSLLGLNFTTFYHYDIYNRSNRDYDSCYFAKWTDFDLGNAMDDYVACNLPTNSYCVYNGDLDDDDGAQGFGTCPPIQNVTFLKNPTAQLNDGLDNDHNGVIDEIDEELGISSFVYYINVNNTYTGNPENYEDYYEYMTGSWLDGVPVSYGGDGRGNGPGATNTPTNFMFPGNSNSQFTSNWNMNLAGIQPYDMRCVGSVGSFDLPAGGKVSFDVALITGPHDSTLNEEMVAKIRAQFRNGKFENFKGTIPNIFGPKLVATSTNVVNYSVSLPNLNNTFLWTVTNGIIQSGQGTNSIDVIWGTAGVGSIVLEAFGASNPCRGKDSITINIGLTSNHEIANEITVRIFPNPTKNTLQIETNGQRIDRAIIYNLEGKIILQQTYVGTINTSYLNSGAYILELLNQQNQSLVRKLFVKE